MTYNEDDDDDSTPKANATKAATINRRWILTLINNQNNTLELSKCKK